MIKNILKFTGMMLFSGVVMLGVSGCGNETNSESKITGADSDIHGCKSSAGFSWCAKTKQCERPWELAKKEKFEKTQKAFNNFCRNK